MWLCGWQREASEVMAAEVTRARTGPRDTATLPGPTPALTLLPRKTQPPGEGCTALAEWRLWLPVSG